MIRRYITRGDVVLILLLSAMTVTSFIFLRVLAGGGKHVVVEVDGRRVLELSLDRDVTETVDGPLGGTVVRIEHGTVHVPDSPCPHKYCVRMGRISFRGEVIVCVPNRVVVSIRGGDDEEAYDGVTQ